MAYTVIGGEMILNLKCNIITALFILTFVLIGCHSNPAPDPNQTVTVVVATLAPIPNISGTSIVTETPTAPIYTATKINTATSIPTNTATPDMPPTSTNLPAISADTGKEVLESFVQKNGGCKLPCIWGLTPGKSTRADVENFMTFFLENAQTYIDQTDSVEIGGSVENDWGGVGLIFWENRVRVNATLDIYNKDDEGNQLVFLSGVFEHFGELIGDNVRTLLEHPYYDELLGHFQLSSVLTTYGIPDKILIRPFPSDPGHPDGQYPFVFVLIYPEQGFLIEYMTVRDEVEGYYVGCPTNSHIDISTWDPENQITLDQAVQFFSGTNSIKKSNMNYFRPIQDVTEMNIMDFYGIFQNPKVEMCVETQKELWP